MPEIRLHDASYRDPDGFVFWIENELYRQVNKSYQLNYEMLLQSNLYQLLTEKKWLVKHEPITENFSGSADWFITLKPNRVPFISYSYEWSFDMLKDAALLTLDINKAAIEHGMILKDATPFNVQFCKGAPLFIDTLSFEKYDETMPWNAYRQFCECFLFPLCIAHYLGADMNSILSNNIDGVPVHKVAKILPFKSRFNLGIWLHVHLQNRVGKLHKKRQYIPSFSKKKLLHLLNNLREMISGLQLNNFKTTWSDYYDETILGDEYLKEKELVFGKLLSQCNGAIALDIGANDGYFSLLTAKKFSEVIAADFDSQCINRLYNNTKEKHILNLLPLRIDVANPSAALGFANRERNSFTERIKVDLVVALALIHHLVITKNIPFSRLASYFNEIAPQLIIEFVPKEDEKVQLLLQNRKDIYTHYTRRHFETAFSDFFSIQEMITLPISKRIIYLMNKKNYNVKRLP